MDANGVADKAVKKLLGWTSIQTSNKAVIVSNLRPCKLYQNKEKLPHQTCNFFTCLKSTIGRLEKDVKYVQSSQQRRQNDVIDVVVISLSLILNKFKTFKQTSLCLYCSLWTSVWWDMVTKHLP